MTAGKNMMMACLRGCLLAGLMMTLAGEVQAQPRVRMKLDLISIRTRSAAPVPVRVRLEYNDPQYLEGSLELRIHDALEMLSGTDRIATVRREGLVLAGQDLEFTMLLPPLKTSDTRNWAVQAWFVTENERIPLSSIPDRLNPPEPFDLLMTSAYERGFLLCSASDDPRNRTASVNRRLLEERLLLQQLLPSSGDSDNENGQTSDEGQGQGINSARSEVLAVHHASEWDIGDLPEDPLGYCAFDVVLLSDGGLAQMSEEQLRGLGIWVRAGGSLCVLAAEPLQGRHLNFLRTVMKQGLGSESDLMQDADGRLSFVDGATDRVVMSHYGLGRAVLLPRQEDLTALLSQPLMNGKLLGFLWKLRQDSILRTEASASFLNDLNLVRMWFPEAKQDDSGIFMETTPSMWVEGLGRVEWTERDGRYYVDPSSIRSVYRGFRLNPDAGLSLPEIENGMLPSDVAMVPTEVIALILIGYVLMIGPVDYFVLGWLQLRKYTWVVFPLVTACFTFLTIVVAHAYMSSDLKEGVMVITDLGEAGTPVRQTTLQTLFYDHREDVQQAYRRALVVQANTGMQQADFRRQMVRPADKPLYYSGTFPQAFEAVQEVQQWSPVTLRTTTLEPEEVNVPGIDWEDTSLVSTTEGIARLSGSLRAISAGAEGQYFGFVMHSGSIQRLTYELQDPGVQLSGGESQQWVASSLGMIDAAESLPTQVTANRGIFSIVSQLSPQGSSHLEDLAMSDASNPEEYVLVIGRVRPGKVDVFRRRYVVASGVVPGVVPGGNEQAATVPVGQ
jgi:hypothetical protein